MTAPRYMRVSRTWLWWPVIVMALALACWFVGRQTVRVIREDERSKVLADGERLAALTRTAYHRVIDSLRHETAKIDTVLVRRLAVVHDTSWLPADNILLPPTKRVEAQYAACRATLDTTATTCAQFRATATAALAAADTQHTRDTTVLRGYALQLAALRREDSAKASRLSHRSRFQTVANGACVGSLAFNAFTLIRK